MFPRCEAAKWIKLRVKEYLRAALSNSEFRKLPTFPPKLICKNLLTRVKKNPVHICSFSLKYDLFKSGWWRCVCNHVFFFFLITLFQKVCKISGSKKKSYCSGKQRYWQAVFCISRPLTTSIVFPLQLNHSWISMNSTWDFFLFLDRVNEDSLFQSQPNCCVHKSPVKTERNTVWPGKHPGRSFIWKTPTWII